MAKRTDQLSDIELEYGIGLKTNFRQLSENLERGLQFEESEKGKKMKKFFCYSEEEVLAWMQGKTKDNGFFDHMLDCSQCAKTVDRLMYLVEGDYLFPLVNLTSEDK